MQSDSRRVNANAPAPGCVPTPSERRRRIRLLMVGDSTGVGVGAGAADRTFAGLLAHTLRVPVDNRCANGARVADVAAQLHPPGDTPRYDLVVVFAGGNDVLRGTRLARLERAARKVLQLAYGVADNVVWVGCADIGIAPALPAPLSWWLGWRCRRAMRTLGRVVRSGGAPFVDFATAEHSARFRAARSHYFDADGLHPSAAAYRECFEIVLRTVPAISRLASARQAAIAGAARVRSSAPAWPTDRARGMPENRRHIRTPP